MVGRRAAAAALVAATLAGCSGGGAAHAKAAPDAGIRTVLAARAASVLHRDPTTFLAGIDPHADRFAAAQRKVFANLAQVPLAAWSYDVVRTGPAVFTPPAAADGAPRTAAEVRLSYRLRGYDAQPVVSTAYLTFDRRGGHWYLAADDDGAASGHRTDVQLWDQGRVQAVRGAHSLVLGLGALPRLKGYAADADRAVPQVAHAWGTGWPGEVVVEAPATLAQMGALLDTGPAAYRGIAAVTTGEAGAGSGAPADRVIVNPDAFGQLSSFGRQAVLTHETTHVATRTATGAATPLWLSEGIADWVAYRESGRTADQLAPELAADVRAGRVPGALPAAADFRPGAPGIAQAYEGGWLACRMIADQWSPQTLTSLYRAVDRGGALDARLRDALGLGLDAFTARWRTYLKGELA
ncbi:hypothetical protein V2S66_06595 [Streptomyces sp. V4-01]|uniref:Lipoprotein n=1 Tax=Actinacidiphila polyblastidii TaxID=3110430 RepID=A0ABU7P744_9ACTN|nr:hypothetical protein [Streptomyces sp. V4-01]